MSIMPVFFCGAVAPRHRRDRQAGARKTAERKGGVYGGDQGEPQSTGGTRRRKTEQRMMRRDEGEEADTQAGSQERYRGQKSEVRGTQQGAGRESRRR